MDSRNQSEAIDFILMGLSSNPKVKFLIFNLFSFVYITTLTGNCFLIVLIRIMSSLRSPMYMFICNLSLLDITFTSVTVPKMLVCLMSKRCFISFNGCFTQLYFYHFLGCSECFILSIMGYDRYVAICHPLRYPQIMSKTCIQLAQAAGSLDSSTLVPYIITARFIILPFQKFTISFVICPHSAELSCTDTS
ncbi:hypothetical protein GDO86_016438 [Hymenochirus boettgeri]|uniref:G-protein coupled receptors family 1 profile domain-containing protein n=1 Tax=Hymenochirus boettgeri TaxID=247094 RepID=A0A8T2K0D0_9PIPI|nr:hypothetical protein GDO86_016438 [Hymenochirus boettgeri]